MIRFISKILIISTFFVGLGAIAEKVKETVIPTENLSLSPNQSECDRIQNIRIENDIDSSKIKVIKLEKGESNEFQFRMILPNIEDLPEDSDNFPEPVAKKKVIVYSQDFEQTQ